MADISKVNVNSTDYDLKDQKSRDALVDAVNNGAKNRLGITLTSGSGDGLTWVVNGDGSVTVSGKNTGNSTKQLHLIGSSYKPNEWKGLYLSGVSGGAIGTYNITAFYSNNGSTYATERTVYNGALKIGDYDYIRVSLQVATSYEFAEPYTFKPMICTKAEWDISQAYVPYGKTNAELTNDTSTLFTENTRQETEIGVVANAGAKNLLKFRGNASSASAGNVYANINADGTVSVGLTSGTTATAQLVFTLGSITKYRDKKLILSGCPAGGNYQSGYALYIANDGATAQADTGSGAILPIVTGLTSSVVALLVRRGTTISSELTFQPMVRPAAITDPTFQPYAKTNRELTVLTDEDRDALVEIVDGSDKNKFLLDEIGKTASTHGSIIDQNGVKYTLNADKTINVLGTATSGAWVYFWNSATNAAKNFIEFFDGKHVATINRGSIPIVLFYAIDGGSSVQIDDGAILPNLNGTTAVIGVQVNKNSVVDPEQTIYPMICTSAAWKISHAYQQYRPSWQELYERIVALETQNT